MSAYVISGKELAERIRRSLRVEADKIRSKLGRPPGLAVMLVGDNPASQVYVRSKTKAALECGITPFDYHLDSGASDEDILAAIREVNGRSDVDGVLLQLPLPRGRSEFRALAEILPRLDADGLHPLNQGLLMRGEPCPRPCTPLGIMALIDQAREEMGLDRNLSGLEACVAGRSVLVGKPVAMLLLERHCSVSMLHSRTRDLAAACRRADILVAAVGRPQLLGPEYIKPGAIVIDVGINRLDGGLLVGDVDFERAVEIAGAITPVPGGVGPMTIAMLMSNTIAAARLLAGDVKN